METTPILIDSSASVNFINLAYAKQKNLPMKTLKKSQRVQVINGRILKNHITTYVRLQFSMMEQDFHQKAYVLDMEGPPHIILGMPWLKEVNPKINW